MSIEMLIAAQKVAAPYAEGGLPPDRLRFTFEYLAPPDLEAERSRLADLLQGRNFELEVLDPLLPQFLVLQFPGVERRMSPETQFAAADELVDRLSLVSAAPDIGATFVVAPPDPDRPEGIGDWILGLTCWVKEDASLPKTWALNAVRVPEAWDRATGHGVVVAQPDTGVADHDELDDALDLGKAWNTLAGSSDPTDPLDAEMGNPGHGTATSSVVASRRAGTVTGTAPDAKVVPIRCVNNVILGLDATPLARAILHAVRIEADVISMSLGGGFYSRSVAAALREAGRKGIIVLSAAGNCVQPIVVYPARDPNVIALAGTNHRDRPWKGTSRGSAVDVAAPAENVFVARRTPTDGGQGVVEPSQGTSFATAMTAGIAALWVERFGRDAIQAEARRRRVSVTTLFRTALAATARRPNGWKRDMGSGIVNAHALLDLPLAEIPAARLERAPSADDNADDRIARTLDDVFQHLNEGDAHWARIGTETVFLLQDAWLRENRGAAIPVESAGRPEPSDGLKERMPPNVREALAEAKVPPLMQPRMTTGVPPRSYARHLAATSASGHESSAALSESAARKRLQGDVGNRLLAQAEKAFSHLSRNTADGDADRREVMQRAREVVQTTAEGKTADLSMPERVVLEALVRIADRPAYKVVNGSIDRNDPLYGEWGGFLDLIVDLPAWTRSVGRIDLDGTHMGTGYLMGGGHVMTNRHVLEACADELVGPSGRVWRFDRGPVTIDFSDTGTDGPMHRLTGVIQTGPDPIGDFERLDRLDLAVLKLESHGNAVPRALPFARELDITADMVVIGFPARPGTSALIDPETGTVSLEIADRLRAIFGIDYGRKYVSPGRVMEGPGSLAADVEKWVATHDATTQGGNSGSAIIQFTAQPAVAALHFSGAPLMANKAHALGRVDKHDRGPIEGAVWV